MKILLLGDVHGYINKTKEIIDFVKCDFVLQTGDLELYSDFSKPTYFIAGNHENWNLLNAIDKGKINFINLHHIKTAEVVELRKNKEVLTLSGINGNYSSKRYGMKIQNRERHFDEEGVEKCKKLKNIDIFLSHEAPLGIGFVKENKDVGVKPIKEILDNVKPTFFFFSHHHKFFEKVIKTTKVFGLDYARREYYILDTNKNKLKKIFVGEHVNERF